MSQSSNLPPLGRIPQSSASRPNFRIAVVAFVALHAVFFAGLLLQGCSPKTQVAEEPPPTNSLPDVTSLFEGWTNAAEPPSEDPPPDAPPPATNTVLALEGTDGPGEGLPGGDETNDTSGGQTEAQRLMEETASGGESLGGTGAQDTGAEDRTRELAQAREHVVEKGDTLWHIAQKYGVTVQEIGAANPGIVAERLQPRQVLVIPAPRPAPVPLEESWPGKVYTIEKGDTLIGISRKFGVTVPELRDVNDLRTDVIMAGKKLKIPQQTAN